MTQFLVAVKIVSVCTFAFGFTDTCFNRLQFCPACFQKHRRNGVYSLQMILQQLGTDNPVTSKSLDVNPLYLLLEHLQPEIQFSVGCFALLYVPLFGSALLSGGHDCRCSVDGDTAKDDRITVLSCFAAIDIVQHNLFAEIAQVTNYKMSAFRNNMISPN